MTRLILFTLMIIASFVTLFGQSQIEILHIDTLDGKTFPIFNAMSASLTVSGDQAIYNAVVSHSDNEYPYTIGYSDIFKINIATKESSREHCEDSVFLRRIWEKEDGGMIYVGRTFNTFRFKDIDTIMPFTPYHSSMSFILVTDALGHSTLFNVYDYIGDAFFQPQSNLIYFTENNVHYNTIRLLKLDLSTGTETVLTTLLTPQRNEEFDLLVHQNRIYISGGFLGPDININGVELYTDLNYNTFLAQLDMNGNLLWFKNIENVTLVKSHLAKISDGGIYWAAEIFEECQLDDFPIKGSNWGNDFFLARISRDGVTQWVIECQETKLTDFELANEQAITTLSLDDVIVAGTCRGGTEWDGVFYGSTTVDNRATIMIFNDKGVLYDYYYDTKSIYSTFNSVVGDGNNFYISGSFYDSLQINETTIDLAGRNNFLAYFSPASANKYAPDSQDNKSFTAYPNPVSNREIVINLHQNHGADFQLINQWGNCVHRFRVNSQIQRVVMPYFPDGTYYLKQDNGFVQKLLILKQ